MTNTSKKRILVLSCNEIIKYVKNKKLEPRDKTLSFQLFNVSFRVHKFKGGMKMEENEEKKVKEVIELVEENINTNEKIYEKRSQLTDDEYLLYTLSREYETKNKNLHRALKNPYFARIDFKCASRFRS